ncbi:MAG: hypothetical protein ABI479_11390 [Gallionella sp.]
MQSCKYSFIVLGFLLHGLASAAESPNEKKPVAEIIPITTSNLRGQESLYREGWFVVSSSENALSYAKEHSLTSSGRAMAQAGAEIKQHSADYGKDIAEVGKDSAQTGAQVYRGGTALTKQELAVTDKLAQAEMDYGSRTMGLAWRHLIQGNMSLAQRTEQDRKALAAVPGDYFAQLKSDFSNLFELTASAKNAMSTHIEGHWSAAFSEAQADFNQSYKQSGERGNSISGLGDILVGYVKVLYSGLLKPATRSTVQGTEAVAKVAGEVIFLPAASLFIVSGRTITSTGLSLYYASSMGVKLVSPTVEGGLLTGLSLFSYGAVPVTYTTGYAVGAVNQIAVTAATPAVTAGKAVAVGVGETGIYAAQVSYDLLKGTTQVAMNQAQSGIVLGYNALTAIPTQLLLGTANGVIFLAYDGPRLVLASAKGEVQWQDDKGTHGSVPVQSLPVGSVVDLEALGKEPGINLQVISDDPELVHQVLEKIPEDLRTGEQP